MQYVKKIWEFANGYKTQSGFLCAGIVWSLEAIGVLAAGTLSSMTPLFIAWIGAAGAAKFQKLVAK